MTYLAKVSLLVTRDSKLGELFLCILKVNSSEVKHRNFFNYVILENEKGDLFSYDMKFAFII